MGRVSRDLHRRKARKLRGKLGDLLSVADDTQFLQLSWAVDMLQSSNGTDVKPYLSYPKEAETTEVGSEYSIYKWELETLILLLLHSPKHDVRSGFRRLLDCRQFGAMGHAANMLRSLENSEYAAQSTRGNIFLEMHRVGHRQFEWQRGFATTERLYRFAYVYGQGECAAYFEEAHGLTVEQFLEVSFVLFAQLVTVPWTKPPDVSGIGLDTGLVQKVLAVISLSLPKMRETVSSLITSDQGEGARGNLRVAYLPSALRRYPVVVDPQNGKIISPLPELIMFRATAGLYYDMRGGPQKLTTEANDRFEQYTREVIQAFCPRFGALESHAYGPKKTRKETPDVMLSDNDQVVAVLECKATKLTYEAQYAEEPFEEAKQAYAQIVKGVAQLWKFFSDVRRGVYDVHVVATNAHGIVLTMEAWMLIDKELIDQVLANAKEIAEETHEIIEADMRPVIFCSIQDLIDVMYISTEDEFLKTCACAELPKYAGWGFREVRRDTGIKEVVKEFPLDVDKLIPWWGKYRREKSNLDINIWMSR